MNVRNLAAKYGFAVAVVAAGIVLRLLMQPLLGNQAPYIFLFGSVAITAWYGGRGPAVVAVFLSTIGTAFFLLDPQFSFVIDRREDVGSLLLFIVVCVAWVALFDSLRAAWHQVREKTQLLETTFASIGDGVITTDSEGRVTGMNTVGEQLTGWQTNDAKGRPLEEVFKIINESTRLPVENPAQQALRRGVIVGLANHTILISKDGSELPIDDSAAPIQAKDGTVIGCVLVFRDVSGKRSAENIIRLSEERKTAILETALDCIISMDHLGAVIEFNPAAERTFGFFRDEILGRQLADFIIPESYRERHRAGLARFLETGDGPVLGKRLELSALRSDGKEFPVELAITRISAEGPPIFTAYLRDLTDVKRVEQHRNTRMAITQGLGGAESQTEGIKGVLQVVCENLNWDVGLYWSVNEEDSTLTCYAYWATEDANVSPLVEVSLKTKFRKGEGLPGRVIESHTAHCLFEVVADKNFPRAEAASQSGLNSAFACPVSTGENTLGVLEFFTHQKHALDDDLIELMGTVSGNVAQFLEKKRIEERILQSESELSDFFEHATVGLHWAASDGTILRANKTELDLLGYSKEEYVGKNIVEFHADSEVIEDILACLRRGDSVNDKEASMRAKDGTIRHVLISSNVLWQNGEFVHTRCFTRDITDRKQAELALQASEERLRLALAAGRMGTWEWNVRDGSVYWSPTLAAIHGLDSSVFTNTFEAYQNDIHPDDREKVMHSITTALEGGTDHHIEYRIVWPDGSLHWIEARGKLYRDVDGQPLKMMGLCMDIDARKSVEEALGFQARLLDSVNQVAIAYDANGDIIYWNQFAEKLLGWSRDEVVGRTALEGMTPFGLEHSSEEIRKVLERGQSWSGELQVQRKDLTTFPALATHTPIVNEAGQLQAVIGIFVDISEQKKTEQTFRFLAQASGELAVLVDYQSTLQKVSKLAVPFFADWCSVDMLDEGGSLSRLAVTHADPSKVKLAQDLLERYPPDPEAPTGVWQVLKTGRPEFIPEIPDELLASTIDDPEILEIVRNLGLRSYIAVPLRVRGESLGVISFVTAESGRTYDANDLAVAEDLAHRATVAIENARLYREVRDADRRKDEFLATLSHELRNPLAPVKYSLELMKQSAADSQQMAEARELIDRQIAQMVRLIDDLLDISRITSNKLELRKERVELKELLTQVVQGFQYQLVQTQHQLFTDLPTEPLYLYADPVRIAQVFGNLLSNALKYTKSGGRIDIRVRNVGGSAEITFEDSGIGIVPQLLPIVFDLFAQGEQTMDRAGGLGIGLSLVRRLVELHEGTVQAYSEGTDRGSRFVVTLPVAQDTSDSRTASESESRESSDQKRKILVVDDSHDNAFTLSAILKLSGNETFMAHDGIEAIEAARSFRPDLILLDIGLPRMNGYDVCHTLRQEPWGKEIVIIALTGWGQEEDRRKSRDAGFDSHMVKPVDLAVLEKTIASLVPKSRT